LGTPSKIGIHKGAGGYMAFWFGIGIAGLDALQKGLIKRYLSTDIRNPLRRAVARKLKRNWAPEQIAGWLKRTYPDDEAYHVSHETIYRSLFVQAR
jgi:IS30 family transposase